MFVLLAMVLVASAQALFFNIAERDVAWAQSLLDGLSWADTFLQKGTLWLALIGLALLVIGGFSGYSLTRRH